ncbi:MAG: TonB-dependent receptor, partial [bacterium]
MNDPDQRHLLTSINFDAIEEVEVETASHPTGAGFVDGGYVNIVTKSGGNKFNGDINLYYTNDKLASTLRSAEESSGLRVSPPPLDRNLWDTSLSLGGSLWEDTLWYFGNFRLISQYQKTPFIPWEDPLGEEHEKYEWHNNEKMGFFKLSGQYASKFKVSAMINYVNRYRPIHEPALNWNLPKEATHILDHEKHLSLNGMLTYNINQNTFANLKAGYLHHKLPLLLNEQGRENPQYFDEGSGHFWGSAGFNERQEKKSLQAGAYLTRFQDNFLGGNHEIEAGVEYEFASGEWAVWKENNLLIHYYYGNPYFYGLDESPVSGETVGKGRIYFSTARREEEGRVGSNPKGELRRISFFAQDSMTFGGRLTLHFGLRFDRSDTQINTHEKGESGNPISVNNMGNDLIESLYPNVNPYDLIGAPFWEDIMTWNAFSPRAGLSFDILGNGKTILKASFSRYTDYMMLQYISGVSPINPRRYHQFYWYDEDGDREVDEDDSYTLYPEDYRMYTGKYYKKRVAPDIKSPYTDEYMIGLYRELFQGFSLRINYIHQTKRNIIENVLYDPENDMDWYTINQDTKDWWIPFQTVVPGVDDYPKKEITVYYRSNSAPKYFYRIKNVPELKRKYQAVEISFNKRMSNNWQLNGSVVLSKATGNIGLGFEESAGFTRSADNTNHFLYSPENSRLDYDRP